MSLIIHYLNGKSEEMESHYAEKEYRDDIIVELNGLYYEVYFFTSGVLKYEMTNDGFFAFPGLIILDEISTKSIKDSILYLETLGYFLKFNGLERLDQEKRFIHNWYANKLSFDINRIESEKLW